MKMTAQPSSILYACILGAAWFDLPACIQRLHTTFSPDQLHGCFFVTRDCEHPAAKFLSRLLHLPNPCSSAHTTLTIEKHGAAEVWKRSFNNQVVVTQQFISGDGLLSERFGHIQLVFRLKAEKDRLTYCLLRAALCVGRFCMSVPRCFSPSIQAIERACKGCDGVEVSVEARLPLFGLTTAYHGILLFAEKAEL
jgi:hypothetical protein